MNEKTSSIKGGMMGLGVSLISGGAAYIDNDLYIGIVSILLGLLVIFIRELLKGLDYEVYIKLLNDIIDEYYISGEPMDVMVKEIESLVSKKITKKEIIEKLKLMIDWVE